MCFCPLACWTVHAYGWVCATYTNGFACSYLQSLALSMSHFQTAVCHILKHVGGSILYTTCPVVFKLPTVLFCSKNGAKHFPQCNGACLLCVSWEILQVILTFDRGYHYLQWLYTRRNQVLWSEWSHTICSGSSS